MPTSSNQQLESAACAAPAPPAVVPVYETERLVGLELEYDAGRTRLNLPTQMPRGFSKKYDGSLTNGVEMVLEPPLRLPDVTPVAREFCEAFNAARVNTCKSGGYHVHVQAQDYSNEDCFKLVKLYTHYQPVINSLIGRSRHNNTFCPPYHSNVTQRDVESMFNLNSPANSRGEAKGSRSYSVINFAMMRTREPRERTVEFRQGSTTKRFECVVGWAALVVAFVDVVKSPFYAASIGGRGTMAEFMVMLAALEHHVGATNLCAWVAWRHHYMNAEPTATQITEAVSLMSSQPRGLFHISRSLNTNLAMAQRVMDRAIDNGMVTKTGTKYQASYAAWSAADLALLEAAAVARANGTPPAPTAEPEEEDVEIPEQ